VTNDFRFEPYTQEFASDPYKVYARMREEYPVYYHEEWDTWIFSTYEDIKNLILDERLGRTMDHISSEAEITAYREKHDWAAAPMHSRYVKVTILDSEAELHNRLRKAVFKVFTVTRVNQLSEFVQALVKHQIDFIESKKEIDFIEDFVAPIPGAVIGKMLGVPAQDCSQLRIWSENIVQFFEPERTDAHRELAERATTEFVEYLTRLTEVRRKKPEDDLLSEMLAWRDENGGLAHEELISTAMIILMAGHGSTIDVSGNGMLALLRFPGQMAELKSDPSLMQTAVQEMFRYDPPLPYFHRYVLEDMEYKGKVFKKGTMLGFLYASANRDAQHFDEPDKLNIKRNPNRHLAFGGGVHHCLGNHLARLNMSIMFNQLLQRLPDIKLAVDVDKLQYRIGCSSRGLTSLPLEIH
jgi:cytochrome P450